MANPPSYEEAMASERYIVPTSWSLLMYRDLDIELQKLKSETGAQRADIIHSQENVQIYFISSDGTVSGHPLPDKLQITVIKDDGGKIRTYLQIGNWIYPLVPGVSPYFQTENTFILPDVQSSVVGATVRLILPEDNYKPFYELLEYILQGNVIGVSQKKHDTNGYSHSISRGIVSGAMYISKGLLKGAAKASEVMNNATPKLIQKIKPARVPKKINPKVSQGIQVAKDVTGTTVHVTGCIVSKIGSATIAVGKYVAPHIQKQSSKLLSVTCNLTEQEASSKIDGVFEVAAGTLEGLGTIRDSVGISAQILASSVKNNTVRIVEHKYGHHVGEATDNTLHTVGNVLVTGHNVCNLTPIGIVKVTAKSAGEGIVEDYRKPLQEEDNICSDLDDFVHI